jgi:hypothetical protein
MATHVTEVTDIRPLTTQHSAIQLISMVTTIINTFPSVPGGMSEHYWHNGVEEMAKSCLLTQQQRT